MGPRGILKTRNEKLDEQDFWNREESGAVALTLVLHRDAQDVWQGFDAGEATDAAAGIGLGQHRYGGRAWAETESVVEVYSAWKGAYCRARRVSVLSRHQLCRRQKSWFD